MTEAGSVEVHGRPGDTLRASAVSRSFAGVRALDDVTLELHRHEVVGLIGPNGAGKSTLVNVLSGFDHPSGGHVELAGDDVTSWRASRRARAGLSRTFQHSRSFGTLSVRENVEVAALGLGARRREARERADELLGLFGLEEAAGRKTRTYSGGMRRRLDLACALVGWPEVLFLDEPSTGLDPAARLDLWEIVDGLVRGGTTVLLTTQHLEEADRLADRVAVLSAGQIVASGTPAELKAQVGRRSATVSLASAADAPRALRALEAAGLLPVYDEERGGLVAPVDGARDLATVVRALDGAGVEASALALAEPTLEDVYLALARRDPSAA